VFAFWALYFIDRDAIFPERLEKFVPPFRNHVMHTLPLITTLIESYLAKHAYPKSFLIGFLPTCLAAFAYLIW
jgi:hypothetical protein